MLLCFIAFHLAAHLPPLGLNTCLQRWGSLCGLRWKGPFLVCSKIYWGCCIFSLSLFVAWPAFPCLCNICSPDLRYPWSRLASTRHLQLSWCVLESASVPKNLGVVIQLHFCLIHLSHATRSFGYFQLVEPLCVFFSMAFRVSCWYLVNFMSVLNFLSSRAAFSTLADLGRVLVGA